MKSIVFLFNLVRFGLGFLRGRSGGPYSFCDFLLLIAGLAIIAAVAVAIKRKQETQE